MASTPSPNRVHPNPNTSLHAITAPAAGELYTAVRLALRHKGGAVLTETMNSNLLNIVVGLTMAG